MGLSWDYHGTIMVLSWYYLSTIMRLFQNGNVPAVVEIEVVLKFHLGGFKGWGGFPFMQDLFQ